MIILLLILSMFVADVAGAATYYVAKTGSGTACTIGSPCLTIATGLSKLSGGDTLNIGPGTYAESISQTQVPSGTAGANTIIQALSGEAIITGALTFNSPGAGVNKEYITLRGDLIFDGNANFSIGGGGNGGDVRFITLDGITSRNKTSRDCMALGGDDLTGHHLTVVNVKVYECRDNGTGPLGFGFNHGIYMISHDSTVRYSTFHDIDNYGFHLNASDGPASIGENLNDNEFSGNTMYNIAMKRAVGAAILLGTPGHNNKAFNNLIYNVAVGGTGPNDGGICIAAAGTAPLVYNNTCYNYSWYGLNTHGSTGAVLRNNIVSSSVGSSTPINNVDGAPSTYSNNLCSTSVTNCATGVSGNRVEAAVNTFVTAGSDFRLKPGSLAIDNGFNLSSVFTTDITGGTRTVPYDIGAYEVGAVISPASVVWTSNRGGPLNSIGQTGPNSGTASLVGSNWTISNIPLSAGINNLVVTYTDTASVQTTDNLVVTYAPTFPGNTLAGAWSFDNVTTDSSGNVPPNNATLLNGATYGAGRFGASALSLDGVNDYALVGDANSLDFTQSFTFSAWVFPTAVQTDWRAAITKNYMIALYASSPYCGAGTPVIYMRVNGQSGPDYYACYANPLPPNQWTHLAGTYDGSNLRLYTDGVLRTTTAATGYIEPSALSMQIGASQFPNEYFAGRIDEARVYNWGIPLTAGSNTTPGAACTQQNYADNASNPSIIGNMNCGIVAVTTPVTIKFPASATSLKVGAASGVVKFEQAGQ